jgi:hypothetical protein
MVQINYKKTDYNQFFFEVPATTQVDQVIAELVEGSFSLNFLKFLVNNLRCVISRLADAMEELAKNGPLRPEETRGLSDDMI